MEKAKLRKIYKKKRKNLSKKEVEELTQSIYKQVFKIDFSTIKTIHIFLPIQQHKEIDTYPIIHFLWQQRKRVAISKSNFTTNTLQHFIYNKDTTLKLNSYGIPEPVNAQEILPSAIDLVFVPLLISDEKNYRVGYGKGFYDRFLTECRKNVKTIGLNFFKPILKITDSNKLDIPLQNVIYPKK